MNILLMMLRSARPSRTEDMKAIAKPRWIKQGYEALTFFGTIITHTTQEAEMFNRRFDFLKNHEMIHLYQARATHDSWTCFYLLYGWYWLCASRYYRRLTNAGYLLNPFELEAYGHMHDIHYLQRQQQAVEWKHYAQMSLAERYTHYTKNMLQKQMSKNLVSSQ